MTGNIVVSNEHSKTMLSKEAILAMPFESFIDLLEAERDCQRGKVIGDVLMEKFKTAVQPVQSEAKLPVARSVADLLSPSFQTGNLRTQAEKVFATHEQNMKNINGYYATAGKLQRSLYAYHTANQGCADHIRTEALNNIKEILSPFFLNAQPAPAKKKWYQFFK